MAWENPPDGLSELAFIVVMLTAAESKSFAALGANVFRRKIIPIV
jgi:hypothetical protein